MYVECVLPGEVHSTGVLKRITKDRAGFLFHRTIVRSRPHSQLSLHRVVEVSNKVLMIRRVASADTVATVVGMVTDEISEAEVELADRA